MSSTNVASSSSSADVRADRVKREGGKVWIAGDWGFDAGEMGSSVHGAQARIAQAAGDPVTYEQLICYGGLAFRVQVHKAMCPSAGHPGPGYTCIENSNRAIGWKMRMFDTGPWVKPVADRATFEREACAAIKASIDRGIPVHYGSEEDGLIIGYADEGRRWWCVHPYYKAGREAFWHDEVKGFAGGKWPWGVVVWTEPKADGEQTSRRELTVAALKQAVEMWRLEKRGDYYLGEAAYGQWLNWLGDVQAGRVADPKAGMQGNGWCYDTLVQYRRAAGRWLKEEAGQFDGEARAQLQAAAGHYAQIAEGCMKGLDCPWNLAVGPDKVAQWTSEMRKDQITRLEAARDHDRAAIAAIEKALGTIERASH